MGLVFPNLMVDITSITVWLAVIAIASALQTLMIIAVAVMGWRVYAQMQQTLERLERNQIEPMMARVNVALEGVHEVIGRVKKVDEDVRVALARSTQRASDAADKVKNSFWPAVAVGRAAYSMFATLRNNKPRRARSFPARPVEHEGGVSYVR